MSRFLVEMYAPGTSDLEELIASARGAADGMEYVRSIFVPEDEVCFHVFDGESAEGLALAFAGARIVEAAEEPR